MSDDLPRPDEAARSLAQRTLDALVFAPAGLLLAVAEDLPELAAKGRARLEGQIGNARVLGQLAVTYGRRDLDRRLARLAGTPEEDPGTGPPPAPPAPDRRPPEPAGTPAGVDLAIPGYDTLSASQVVRRLDGLGPQELAAVERHEAATRGRRTILHRAQQLLGSEDPPGR